MRVTWCPRRTSSLLSGTNMFWWLLIPWGATTSIRDPFDNGTVIIKKIKTTASNAKDFISYGFRSNEHWPDVSCNNFHETLSFFLLVLYFNLHLISFWLIPLDMHVISKNKWYILVLKDKLSYQQKFAISYKSFCWIALYGDARIRCNIVNHRTNCTKIYYPSSNHNK